MAAAESEEGWEVQCSYCWSSGTEMNNPRKLPCGHVNCLKGIQDDLEANNILRCPKCRKSFDLQPEDLDMYCSSDPISSILPCEVCLEDKKEAKVYCPTCSRKLCKHHEKEHENWFPMHTNVISIADYENKSRRLTPHRCLKHEEEQLLLICQHCSTKFCGKCEDTDDICVKGGIAQTHHKLTSIRKLSGKLSEDLTDFMSRAIRKETTYNNFAKECSQILCDFDTETSELMAVIQAKKKEQLDALGGEYVVLETRLCDQREETRNAITQFVDGQIKAKETEILNQIQLIDTSIQYLHEIDVIESHSKRMAYVEKLVAEPMPYMTFERLTKLQRKESNIEPANSGQGIKLLMVISEQSLEVSETRNNKGEHRIMELDLESPDVFTIGEATKVEKTLDCGLLFPPGTGVSIKSSPPAVINESLTLSDATPQQTDYNMIRDTVSASPIYQDNPLPNVEEKNMACEDTPETRDCFLPKD